MPCGLALSGCGSYGPPAGSTRQAQAIHGLWGVLLWTGIAVGIIVYALILWSVLRYRNRSDATPPPQFTGNPPLEITWTVIPLLIVGVLFFLTYRVERYVQDVSPHPAVTVNVTAFRWSWRFLYQGSGKAIAGTPDQPPQLVLPVGQTVRVIVTSQDVVHSFYVPEFLFKRDAIPGVKNAFDLDIAKPGVYRGECAEFCGLSHARMLFTVKAVPAAAFASWMQSR
ncbi:MAG: cytochrome c oxidase subunit II [Candidatus Eremiobacteraeota bacterium]|nr:cytochrome c oxidase subunit II [Candidatus Eremiobacteraeota bacterium]